MKHDQAQLPAGIRALLMLLIVTILVGCSAPMNTQLASVEEGKPINLGADLSIPDGPGPFPAVMLMHGSGGYDIDTYKYHWTRWFKAQGIATLAVDSYTGRGWGSTMTDPAKQIFGPTHRLEDARAGLAFLRAHPKIDANRVILMGFSGGAVTALLSQQNSLPIPFNAFIALYPYCDYQYQPRVYAIPTLILIGANDTATPAEACQKLYDQATSTNELLQKLNKDTNKIELHVYPNAYHAFDDPYPPVLAEGCCIGGKKKNMYGNDPVAYRQSMIDVAEFLNRHLKLAISAN